MSPPDCESPYVSAADVQDHQAKLPVLILVLLVHQLSVVSLQGASTERCHITRTQPDLIIHLVFCLTCDESRKNEDVSEELTTWELLEALATASPLSL